MLSPGSQVAADLLGDQALIAALLQTEVAWAHALAAAGAVSTAQAEAVAAAADTVVIDPHSTAEFTAAAGNPAAPVAAALRAQADAAAPAVHRGLTSQDALDTALMLLTRNAFRQIATDLSTTADALADLAREHRDTVAAGRTLTQWAVPVTVGLRAAQWLTGVLDARQLILDRIEELPVQYGGAAGTRALGAHLAPGESDVLPTEFARRLQLRSPQLPWHTRRSPVTGVGDAAVTVTDALGVLAADVALLGRPEIDELRERGAPGHGTSSTMPHKQNPVRSVLIRSLAAQTPLLAAQLHLAAATAVDERPDGAWHSEWRAFVQLLESTVTTASLAAPLATGLEVHTDATAARVEAAAPDLTAEGGSSVGDPASYLGDAGRFVDLVLERHATGTRP
nr:lyase family protein [Flexivirga aerilata]